MANGARVAVVFLLLLAGAEAYKIQGSATQTAAALAFVSLIRGAEARRGSGEEDVLQRDQNHAQQTVHELQKSISDHAWRKRSPVCKSALSPSAAVEHYIHKCEKLTELAAEYDQDDCVLGCPLLLGKALKTFKEFKTCYSDPERTLPSELKEVMLSGDMAIKKVMLKARQDMIKPAKRKGFFPEKGSCEFMPLHPGDTSASADSMDALRSQVFGAGCTSEESVKEYVESFPKAQRIALEKGVKELEKVAELRKKGLKGELKMGEIVQVEEEVETLISEANVTSGAASLIEEDAEGRGVVLVVVLLILILFMALYLHEIIDTIYMYCC